MTGDGSVFVTSEELTKGSLITWRSRGTGAVLASRNVAIHDIHDLACVEGTDSVAVASEDGGWLVSRSGKKPLLLVAKSLDRICPARMGGLTLLGLTDYHCLEIKVHGEEVKVTSITADQTNPFERFSAIVALPNGATVLPDQGLKYVPSSDHLLKTVGKWEGRGIYDIYTNANRFGSVVHFEGVYDPTHTVVFIWQRTKCWTNGKTADDFHRIHFPSNVRVASAFLTDTGDLWYAANQGLGKTHLRRLDISKWVAHS